MTPPPRNRHRQQHPANRRRPRPSATHDAARRHSRWLALQLARAGTWLRALPTRLRSTADASSKLLRPWSEPAREPALLRSADPDDGPQIVLDDAELDATSDRTTVRPRLADAPPTPTGTLRTPTVPASLAFAELEDSSAALTHPSTASLAVPGHNTGTTAAPGRSAEPGRPRAPRPLQRASAFSKQLAPRALALGREFAPRAADLGRQLGRQIGPLARRGAAATGQGLRAGVRRLADLRPLLRLLGRFFAAIGGATVWLLRHLASGSTIVGDRTAGALQRHQNLLLGLFTRALWWTALVLLFLGGRALVEIHERNPFLEAALPSLLAGLALCAFLLLFASQARMRWAAFALGLGHGGLLALVWVVSAIA